MEELDINKKNEKEKKPEKIKTPIITFAKLNKFFLIPFLTPISSGFTYYFTYLIDETNVIKNKLFIFSIYDELSYIVVGLFYFVSYFKLKPKKEKKKRKRI